MSDMHEDITSHVAYDKGVAEGLSRGKRECDRVLIIQEDLAYDKGFVAGKKHAHDLLTQYAQGLRHKRQVMESEGLAKYDTDFHIQSEINLVEELKLLIRVGHYDEHT